MKELTIEQKAKAYDEALERARNLYNSEETSAEVEIACENIFPELIEFKDERIRKALMRFHKNTIEIDGIKGEDIIAWLEKQGEQIKSKSALETAKEVKVDNQNCVKPTDKPKFKFDDFRAKDWYVSKVDGHIHNMHYSVDNVEPKFHEGDWIVSEVTGSAYQIKYCVENLNTHKYGYDLTNGGYLGSYDANHYHLWTVQDAKDGDVLVASDNSIFIFSHCIDNACVHYIAFEVKDGTIDINDKLERGWETKQSVRPATKKQCELLLQKMKEAGYEFDLEKKVLKKIKEN